MRRLLSLLALAAALIAAPALAQEQPDAGAFAPEAEEEFSPGIPFAPDEFFLGKVESIVETGEREIEGFVARYQVTRIRITSGAEKGKTVDIEHALTAFSGEQKAKVGETVVVTKITAGGGEPQYQIADAWRLPALGIMALLFFALIVFFGRGQGLRSVLGLAVSVLVIVKVVMPRIISGESALAAILLGALIIMAVSLYLAHGFRARTHVALGATAITFCLAGVLAAAAVALGRLYGLGSEDSIYLQLGPLASVNLRGLLLGGILLGTLGVLDDVTTAQAATVEELRSANPKLSAAELYRRGLSVGREHISSLVNTLFLAYAGASLPLFLIFATNRVQPLWTIVNGEAIAEEIVRTLIGSATLVLAVPITTRIAALYFSKRPPSGDTDIHHVH